jgi:peroxiredoxin
MKNLKIALSLVVLFLAMNVNAQKTMPSVKLKTLEGKEVDLKEITSKGHPVVLSFWATWCSPCKKELDAINEVYADWKKLYNVEVIAVTIDDARALAKVAPMVKEKGWTYTILSDVNRDVQRALNFQSVPQSYLIDSKGIIVFDHTGYSPGDEDEMEEQIKKLK